MTNLSLYCVTNKSSDFLEGLPMNLVGVGQNKFNDKYLRCDHKDNIFYKEKYYSELTFHYWYWKNLLKNEKNKWVGFCQKRRFWVKSQIKNFKSNEKEIKNLLLTQIDSKYDDYDSFICLPIKISGARKTKILKRGWRNLFKDPSILFNTKKETISLHFDMHHGYKNMEKAIKYLNSRDKEDFTRYVSERDFFNPHIMCIAKPEILSVWFKELFNWLERCETEFGFKNLKGYDNSRLYAYLAERYMSFWFKKYTKFHEQPWAILE